MMSPHPYVQELTSAISKPPPISFYRSATEGYFYISDKRWHDIDNYRPDACLCYIVSRDLICPWINMYISSAIDKPDISFCLRICNTMGLTAKRFSVVDARIDTCISSPICLVYLWMGCGNGSWIMNEWDSSPIHLKNPTKYDIQGLPGRLYQLRGTPVLILFF